MKKSSILKLQKAVAIAMAFLFFCVVTTYAAANESKSVDEEEVDLYFALSDKHGFPLTERKTSFDCSDKIFAVVDVHNYEKKTYTLSFAWIDPAGKERELTEYPFTVREHCTLVGNTWSEYQAKFSDVFKANITGEERVVYPSAAALLALAERKYIEEDWVSAVSFEPIYVRNDVAKKSSKA